MPHIGSAAYRPVMPRTACVEAALVAVDLARTAACRPAGRSITMAHHPVTHSQTDERVSIPRTANKNSSACGRSALYGPVMVSDKFVPVGFDPPTSLATDQFRLEPLGPEHNQADHAAWTSSIDHIRSTPGFADGNWPPPH